MHFADCACDVAALLKKVPDSSCRLWEWIVKNSGSVRMSICPCHDGASGWDTHRRRAIGVFKPNSAGGDLVDMRRSYVGTSIATRGLALVLVRHNEQQVRLPVLC